jgi:hypothetical protein
MNLDVGPQQSGRGGEGRRAWWTVVAAAAVVGVVAAVVGVGLLDGDDGELTLGNGPATSESGVTTSAPETKSTPSTTSELPSKPASAGRTSPLEVFGACKELSCPSVEYAADGLAVAYRAESKTITVLEATPRTVSLDIAETRGRLLAVGPDEMAYLVVDSAEEGYPGRILGVALGAEQAGTVHEVVGPTNGLGNVFVAARADGIDVADCCGMEVPDGHYSYVDADGAAIAGDPTLAAWSWEWPSNSRVIVRSNVTGRDYEVPQQIPEREGLRSGDLRPLLDGRVAVIIDDEMGVMTAWVLDHGTWTSTELGFVNVVAIDPAGAVLTSDRSTLAYDLVPLG